ncbi:NAD(P)-binding protein [Zopfia rhizophila CBS 207.26]|uniref:NAD(P)-binding protein n=1 Tax=Zopfia rhizophila CBS 207.26 TaxID=1314779 RepID=A0A6A6DWK8_9PEZI|nr:NAD(P)-binding protein [Zopfia rhizophila CBS 207.26]
MASQKSVLITGCSAGGIGSSIAFSFAKRGLSVFATARNASKIDPKLSALDNVEVLTLDATSPSSISAAAQAVSHRTGGKLDYLVNSAGSGLVCPFLDTDLQKARELFDVNFWGVLQCIQVFKEQLIAAKGTIVNVSSVSGVAPNPYESIYNASKAALTHFDSTICLELAPLGVNVVSLITGMIKSNWYSNSVPQIELPKDSYYHPVIESIRDGMTKMDNKKKGTNVDVFGESVVKDVLGGKKGIVWKGALSRTVWLASFLPSFVMVCLFLLLHESVGLG